MKNGKVKLAVVQASPVLFDKESCIDKLCSILEGLAGAGPDLVLFPEAFIPGYPHNMSFGTKSSAIKWISMSQDITTGPMCSASMCPASPIPLIAGKIKPDKYILFK